MCKFLFLLSISIVCCFAGSSQADIFALGDLPGGIVSSSLPYVSADGQVVAGTSNSTASAIEGFRWEDGVMTGLGFVAGQSGSPAQNISADGSFIVDG